MRPARRLALDGCADLWENVRAGRGGGRAGDHGPRKDATAGGEHGTKGGAVVVNGGWRDTWPLQSALQVPRVAASSGVCGAEIQTWWASYPSGRPVVGGGGGRGYHGSAGTGGGSGERPRPPTRPCAWVPAGHQLVRRPIPTMGFQTVALQWYRFRAEAAATCQGSPGCCFRSCR